MEEKEASAVDSENVEEEHQETTEENVTNEESDTNSDDGNRNNGGGSSSEQEQQDIPRNGSSNKSTAPDAELPQQTKSSVSESSIENSEIRSTCPEEHHHTVLETLEENIQHHSPLYIGLSILFLLVLAIFGINKMSSYKDSVTTINYNIADLNSRISGISLDMQKIDATVNGFEDNATALELKKILLTLDVLIKRTDDPTRSAAEASKQSIVSLLKTMDSWDEVSVEPVAFPVIEDTIIPVEPIFSPVEEPSALHEVTPAEEPAHVEEFVSPVESAPSDLEIIPEFGSEFNQEALPEVIESLSREGATPLDTHAHQ